MTPTLFETETAKAFRCFIPIIPLTQQGGRTQHVLITPKVGKPFHTRVKDKELRANEKQLENFITLWKRKWKSIDCNFKARLIFVWPLLEKHRASKPPISFALKGTSPDLGNVEKTLMDVLQRCEIFTNDARCCMTEQCKVFGRKIGVGIEIYPVTDDDTADARRWYEEIVEQGA